MFTIKTELTNMSLGNKNKNLLQWLYNLDVTGL